MDMEQLRQKIASGELKFESSNSVIKTGELLDYDATSFKYEIIHGWDITLSYECDREWKAFYFGLFEFINNQNFSERELKEVLSGIQLQDKHWDWFKKSYIYHSDEYEWFYLLANEKPQGACVFFHPKKSIIDTKYIFYIEYVAVAPWNRETPVTKRKFKGVGTILIKCALNYAVNELGLQYGFSLHSLPESKNYYEKIGMINFPERDKDKLVYFEMPRDKSTEMLGGS
jgi:hypothetical protein